MRMRSSESGDDGKEGTQKSGRNKEARGHGLKAHRGKTCHGINSLLFIFSTLFSVMNNFFSS